MVDDLRTEILELTGFKYAYIDPPSGFKLKYPCAVIETEVGKTERANNRLYLYTSRYTVTIMTTDTELDIVIPMLTHFKYCSESSRFISDNLAHFVFDLFY